LHIGLLIYGQLNYPSGGFLYDRKLVEHLQSTGHKVTIFSQAWASPFGKIAQNWDRALLQKILASDLDVLIQDELNHASLFIINKKLKKQSSIPIIALVHHLRLSEAPSPGKLSQWIEGQYLQSVDSFLVNSATTERSLAPWIEDDRLVQVAQPGGDRLDTINDPAEIRKRAAQAGPLRVLFVGSLTIRKQAHLILEAINLLPKGLINATFAGDTNADAEYVKQLDAQVKELDISEYVRFIGHVENQRLIKELENAHVFVLPSSYEGFGIAFLEAMAFGLPAIGINTGGAADIIEHEFNGFLLNKSESKELAKWLSLLANDRKLLATMGKAAYSSFEKFPTWQESMALAQKFIIEMAQ
jgi:glycosyltransferase involved in cell wall biosynthesis